jgi:hypothetical protein
MPRDAHFERWLQTRGHAGKRLSDAEELFLWRCYQSENSVAARPAAQEPQTGQNVPKNVHSRSDLESLGIDGVVQLDAGRASAADAAGSRFSGTERAAPTEWIVFDPQHEVGRESIARAATEDELLLQANYLPITAPRTDDDLATLVVVCASIQAMTFGNPEFRSLMPFPIVCGEGTTHRFATVAGAAVAAVDMANGDARRRRILLAALKRCLETPLEACAQLWGSSAGPAFCQLLAIRDAMPRTVPFATVAGLWLMENLTGRPASGFTDAEAECANGLGNVLGLRVAELTKVRIAAASSRIRSAVDAYTEGANRTGNRPPSSGTWPAAPRPEGSDYWRLCVAYVKAHPTLAGWAIIAAVVLSVGLACLAASRGDLTGTTWHGGEVLPGFGPLTFEFRARNTAIMTDAKGQVRGSWSRSGDHVTIHFLNCEYEGTITGSQIRGTARYFHDWSHWPFTVHRN